MSSVLREFLLENGPESYKRLLDLVGPKEAKNLIPLSRNAVICRLAKSRRFTFRQIGSVFGVTGERIRQIAPYPKDFTKSPKAKRLLKVDRKLNEAGIPMGKHKAWVFEAIMSGDYTFPKLAQRLKVTVHTLQVWCQKHRLHFYGKPTAYTVGEWRNRLKREESNSARSNRGGNRRGS